MNTATLKKLMLQVKTFPAKGLSSFSSLIGHYGRALHTSRMERWEPLGCLDTNDGLFLLAAFVVFWGSWILHPIRFTQITPLVSNLENSSAQNRPVSETIHSIQDHDVYEPISTSDSSESTLFICLTTFGCASQAAMDMISTYMSLLEEGFGWTVVGDWKLEELQVVYDTAIDIMNYADKITSGRGIEWMLEYVGGLRITHFDHAERGEAYPNTGIPVLPRAGILYLGPGWEDPARGWDPKQLFAHELGHIWDCRSGGSLILGCAGGMSDQLMSYLGVKPNWIRFNGQIAIPFDYQWLGSVNARYGNRTSVDYMAELFSWNIYDPANLPKSDLGRWVDHSIAIQASLLP